MSSTCRPQSAPPGTRIRFTFQWRDAERWEGADFLVLVDGETGIAAGHAAAGAVGGG